MSAENGVAAKKSQSEDKYPPAAPGRPGKVTGLGYGDTFPSHFLQEHTFELRYKEKARKVGIIISRSLLVINLYSSAFLGKITMGDFILKVNDKPVVRKDVFYEQVEAFLKTHEKFTITVKRPKWLTPTTVVPKGYDIAPGYEYFSGLLVLYPNSTVGLNVKTFNSRVYVVRVEGDSIAVNTCMVGDCIVDVDGVPVTTVTDCSEKIVKALKDKKYVQLTIERAATPLTIRAVRCALFAEKTTPMDPRLATDTTKIGEEEAAKVKACRVPEAPVGILKTTGQGVTGVSVYGSEKPHIGVRPTSEEITIGCEPYNPLFFHKVKSKTAGYDTAASAGITAPSVNSNSKDSISTESNNQSQDKLSADKIVTPPGMAPSGSDVVHKGGRANSPRNAGRRGTADEADASNTKYPSRTRPAIQRRIKPSNRLWWDRRLRPTIQPGPRSALMRLKRNQRTVIRLKSILEDK
uniref:PDZ domain-containing protein n=1 Tax=Panagrellus redivivus TaxID=6233 RepID=A0A7E4ZZP1_PANRE